MAKQVPQTEPRELVIGSSWAWDITYPDFPADESWQLNYYLRAPNDSLVFTFAWSTHVSAGDGSEFEVRVTDEQSGALNLLGEYRLVGRVSKAGDTWDGEIVYNSHVLLLPNPSATTVPSTVAGRSFNRQMLAAIEAALLAGVSQSSEAKRISVNGRSIEYRDLAELEGRRAHYALMVAIEENPNGRIMHEVEFVG